MSADYYLHTDNPTEIDSLGRAELVADMVRRVVNCECPQVLGLHGDWGSGKTSALMQVRKELAKTFDESAPVVWFEAWRYQNESTPIVALLHAIRERLSWRSKAWNETKKLGELRQWLAPSFNGTLTAVDEFIQFVARRAGLLLPRGEGVFAFAHLSFQEYYAARHLKAEFSRLSFGSDDPESLPVEAIQASYEKLIEWSRESAWREVFIFLVESQKEDVHITWALVQKIFLTDVAKEEAEELDQDGQPHRCLPLVAAELLGSLSVNRDVSLHDSHRQKIWNNLWQAYLRWPFEFGYGHSWPIASTLLQSTPYQQQVVQALVEQAAKATRLSLRGCSQLTDFAFLTHLPQLLTLDLSWGGISNLDALQCTKLQSVCLNGCSHLTNLVPLRVLPLQSLSLVRCIGLTTLEPLRALPLRSLDITDCRELTSLDALRSLPLQSLYLGGCSRVSLLEPLRGLPLQVLSLWGCTGVKNLEPLRTSPLQSLTLSGCTGVTSLEPLRTLPLQSLTLSGCTGVTSLEPLRTLPLQSLFLEGCEGLAEEEVAALKEALPECEIHGP